MKRSISIIIPFYNEAQNLGELYIKLLEVIKKLSDYSWDFIFVDDGSVDKSSEVIEQLRKKDKSLHLLQFTRNFGKEIATTAGINNCKSDACIIMDADLQHPPLVIPKLVEKWEKGAPVVVGVRKRSTDETIFKRVGSKLFYWIINRIGEINFVPNSTDFRLLDRQVVNEFNRLSERNRITRGLIAWLGFSRVYVNFTARERKSGRPSYGIIKLFRLAFSSFVSLSLIPLRLAGYLGIIITILSGGLGFSIVVEQFILHDPLNWGFTGTAMLAVLIIFLVGLILISLGLIALYIANIHGEVINRPLYVINKRM